MQRIALLLLAALAHVAAQAQHKAQAQPQAAIPAETQASGEQEPANNYSFMRYRADYEAKADATSVQTSEYEILVKTKAGVDEFSQVRLSYSDRMETLEVLGLYRCPCVLHDVPAGKIYTMKAIDASAAMMRTQGKSRFRTCLPHRLVIDTGRADTPDFPGYFAFGDVSVFTQS